MNPNNEARVPPRFVPTLTEVVDVPEWVLPGVLPVEPMGAPAPWAALEPVPVPEPEPQPQVEAVVPPVPSPDVARSAVPDAWADEITRRVTERLEQRLASMLAQHSADMAQVLAQTLAQQLRGELPALVRQAVESSEAPFSQWPAGGQ
ncbi:MAG: hypothetical protein Q8S12_10935 [Hydrogenophaga sp.]|uniref:hypothetical protein n=1 Tax=Hydrogenophaga sp. TaxID=1904254 RepID=UPI0027364BF8|nr:hypothetical protein [Hydrogenophaga sp.]MDP3627105.1 hypothetical protein [Hydrogenophaga sp.]